MEGSLLGLPVISLVAFGRQSDNKLCITTSTGIKTLGMRNDGCFSDPYKFAWGQNTVLPVACFAPLLPIIPAQPEEWRGCSADCQHYLWCR